MTNSMGTGYPAGHCRKCGDRLRESCNATSSELDLYCDYCRIATPTQNHKSIEELPKPIKKKKSRLSRMEKEALYGGIK